MPVIESVIPTRESIPDGQSSMSIDWASLAESLGTIQDDGESGGSDAACRAFELILGTDACRSAVDHYVSLKPGYELVRSVLWHIHPWSAMERCYEIYNDDDDIETRRSAIELLRVIADKRVLPWIPGFLQDPDDGIQSWGAGIVDQLLFSDYIEPADCDGILAIMADHANEQVRHTHESIRSHLNSREESV